MENIVNLSELKEGVSSLVFKVNNINEKWNRRLVELGFVKNQKIEVIKNLKRSKLMLVSVRGYALSIDYVIAQKIMVYKR